MSTAVRKSCVWLLVAIHTTLLAYAGLTHTPLWDEWGHLVAGISHWQLGTFDLYRVNPPLVRSIAAAPVVLAEPSTDWSSYDSRAGMRSERQIREDFIQQNGGQVFWLFTIARWACIPFSWLGAYVCCRWAKELYGEKAGVMAVVLWCFSPNVLAHGSTIMPDTGATATGVFAAYWFWRWLRLPTVRSATIAGAALGLAELTKTTWLLLFFLWPMLWLLWRLSAASMTSLRQWLRQLTQLLLIVIIAIWTINLGYAFEGSFRRLSDFDFTSTALGGNNVNSEWVRIREIASTARGSKTCPFRFQPTMYKGLTFKSPTSNME